MFVARAPSGAPALQLALLLVRFCLLRRLDYLFRYLHVSECAHLGAEIDTWMQDLLQDLLATSLTENQFGKCQHYLSHGGLGFSSRRGLFGVIKSLKSWVDTFSVRQKVLAPFADLLPELTPSPPTSAT